MAVVKKILVGEISKLSIEIKSQTDSIASAHTSGFDFDGLCADSGLLVTTEDDARICTVYNSEIFLSAFKTKKEGLLGVL